jgi:diguanylate cyclase (GGDEF)-like protein
LGTPLLDGERLVGVLTVYSTNKDAFSDDHRRVIEVIARQVSKTVKHAIDFESEQSSNSRDQLTGLPNQQQLERLVASEFSSVAAGAVMSIAFVEFDPVAIRNQRQPKQSSDQILTAAASAIRQVLRRADALLRPNTQQFVALLTQTDSAAADFIASRIRDVLAKLNREHGSLESAFVIGVATAPIDGVSLDALIGAAAARARAGNPPDRRPPSVH